MNSQNKKIAYFEDYDKRLIKLKSENKTDNLIQEVDFFASDGKYSLFSCMMIDLVKLKKNIKSLRSTCGKNTGIIGVIKSDAYGYGLIPIAKTLGDAGVEMLGVGEINDVIKLRKNGISSPILCLYPLLLKDIKIALLYNAEITLSTVKSFSEVNTLARRLNKIARVHLQIETGLNKYGMCPRDVETLISFIANMKFIELIGVSTHFADAKNDSVLANYQFKNFLEALSILKRGNVQIQIIHLANSAAIVYFPKSWDKSQFSHFYSQAKIYIRPGLLMYGLFEKKGVAFFRTLPILDSISSHIAEIKEIDKGQNVGYFNSFKSKKKLHIATIPMGWGNSGYIVHRGKVIVNNKACRVIGAVSSNAFSIVVGESEQVGDKVSILSEEDRGFSLNEVFKYSKQFPLQMLSIFGSKMQRVYFE